MPLSIASLIHAISGILLLGWVTLAFPATHPPSGGGGFNFPFSDENSKTQRPERQNNLTQSLTTPQQTEKPLTFLWPLAPTTTLTDFHYYGFSNFVDHDPNNPDSVMDFNCGTRSYDVVGYNHLGTDIFLWPFPWNKMQDNLVSVVAAAEGVIVHKQEGNDDDSCAFTGKDWNGVAIQHADGSTAWYFHFKKNTVLTKVIGEHVDAGEYLGIVGSSGNSSIPHLHIEIYDAQGQLIDPYQGTCNDFNDRSWWANQPAYYDSRVNHLATGFAAPDLGTCPGLATPNEQKSFVPGSTVYFSSYFHDQRNLNTVQYQILRPNGSVYDRWEHRSDQAHYNASYWYWSFDNFAPEGPYGVWTFAVDYLSTRYEETFYLAPEINLPALTLKNNQWQQITLPVDLLPDNTVTHLFGEILPPSDYGKTWQLFSFDANTEQYTGLDIDAILERGTGYWIIQLTGEAVTLQLTSYQPWPPEKKALPVVSDPNEIKWNMIGYPHPLDAGWDQSIIVANTGLCSSGCSITQASDYGLFHHQGWFFDGDQYQLLEGSSRLNPWMGLWAAALPADQQLDFEISADLSNR